MFVMLKGNCLVAQSGGPTAAINATLCGVFKKAFEREEIQKIYGGLNGIEGIREGKLIDLSFLEDDGNRQLLLTTPASFLGSCRYKLKSCEDKREDYEKLLEVFRKYDIRYFFYIGGNDSMDTIKKLSVFFKQNDYEIKLIGLPKTIDNDLVLTDHTPGFGSSAKYIASAVKEIAADSAVYDIDSVTVIEVMGRNTGWLSMAAALARDKKGNCVCDLIYTPEIVFDYDKCREDIKEVQKHKRQVIVVISEGIKDKDGRYIENAEATDQDMFGHAQLGGAGKYLENMLKKDLGIKVRSVEINVLQRCAGHIVSKRDIEESESVGEAGVEAALEGESGKMVTMKRKENTCHYDVYFATEDINKIANYEKNVPETYLNEAKNHVSALGLQYLRPLIEGEMEVPFEEGIPAHLCVKDFIEGYRA